MRRLLRKLALALLLLPMLLFGCALFALFTESGTRFLLRGVQQIVPLDVQYAGGTLLDELRFDHLRYRGDGLRLDTQNLVVALSATCVLRAEVCLETLAASHLAIDLPAAEKAAPVVPGTPANRNKDAALIVFPLPVTVELLEIESGVVTWQDGAWMQGATQAQLHIFGSTIEVFNAVIHQAKLELRPSEKEASAAGVAFVPPRIDLPLDLKVHGLDLVGPSWNIYESERVLQRLALQGRWRNTRLQLQQLDADSAHLGRLSLEADMSFSGDWPVQGRANISLAEAPPVLGPQGQELSAFVEGTLSSLNLRLEAEATPSLLAVAETNLLDEALPSRLRVSTDAPELLRLGDIAGLPEALLSVQFESATELRAEGSLAAQDVQLQTQLSGMGYHSLPVFLKARHEAGTVFIDDLSLGDSSHGNDLRVSGELDAGETMAWQLSVRSSGLDLPQLSERVAGRLRGSLQFNGHASADGWRVDVPDVAVTGVVNGLPASISGFAGFNHQLVFAESNLDADINGAQLTLLSAGDEEESSEAHLLVDKLGLWLPGSDGTISVTAQVGGNRKLLDLSAQLKNLRWQDMTVSDGTITGVLGLDSDGALAVDASFDGVRAGDVELDSFAVAVKGTRATHALSVGSAGDIQGELNLSGRWHAGVWEGVLAPTTLELPLGDWHLTESVAMTGSTSAQQLGVAGHCWRHQTASVCARDSVLGRAGKTSLELTGDTSLLAHLFPPNVALTGAIKMTAEAHWSPEGGVFARGQAESSSLHLMRQYSFGEQASIHWDKFSAQFDYDASGLALQLDVHREGRSVLDLDSHIAAEREGPVTGSVQFERLQLMSLAPFFPALSRLEGEVSGAASLSGTVEKPSASGVLGLKKGVLVLVGNPTELDIHELTLDLEGDSAGVRGKASLGGGPVEISGRMGFRPELFMDVAFSGQNHAVLYPPATELLISENLQIVATEGAIDISGDVSVLDGVLKFEQLPEGSVAVSDDVVQVDFAGNVVRENLPFDVSMDVRVDIPDGFKVTGSTLESKLAGKLHLQQQPGGYLQIVGILNIKGGELQVYKQRLQVKRGAISFSGEPDNPKIDVRAQRDINSNVSAGVQLTGFLQDELILEVYSEPAMSQREALSYLLRGRGLDEGTGTDSTALALTLAGGVLNRTALVSELNRIPGISSVEFGAEGSAEEVVGTVSGYVGEKIYLSYGIGLYEPINILTARFYLFPSLWFEIVSRLENSIDLYYSFDID